MKRSCLAYFLSLLIPDFVFQYAVCALMKSQLHTLDLAVLMEHYGDSLLAYLPASCKSTAKKYREPTPLPITIKSKIKYVNVRPMIPNRMLWDRQTVFPDSTLRGPRREIRYIIKHKMFINLKLENNLSDYPHDRSF